MARVFEDRKIRPVYGGRGCLLDEGPVGFDGGMTMQKYAFMTHCSRATAFRDLDQVTGLGILRREGQWRAVRYVFGVDGGDAKGVLKISQS